MEKFENYYTTASPSEKTRMKKWLKGMLEVDAITIEFLKANGEKRSMKCTLKSDVVTPYEKKTERKPNEEVCFVFDVEKNEWRSFRYDRITAINITL